MKYVIEVAAQDCRLQQKFDSVAESSTSRISNLKENKKNNTNPQPKSP